MWGTIKHLPALTYISSTKDSPYQDGGPWHELRDSQTIVLKEQNTALAVTLGLGQNFDVHPSNKMEVGRRAANCALQLVYGKKLNAYTAMPQNSSIDKQRVVIKF